MQLQLKPYKRNPDFKYKLIEITDIALHSSFHRQTGNIGKKINRSFRRNKSDRIYNSDLKSKENNSNKNKMTIDLIKMDPNFLEYIRNEEKRGYKVVLSIPKKGVPVILGKDTEEFINSTNGKRLIRGIN